jgi:adenine/guanine phosphoribosyltransferase-like PRPP-binding protein
MTDEKDITCRSSYLHEVLDVGHRSVIIAEIVNQLTKYGLGKFDTIAFRGMSGALVVPEVAAKINKPMLMIRKSDGHHSSWSVEGNTNLKSYIIIDDLIASGATVKNILEGVEGSANYVTDCKAIFLYRDSRRDPFPRCENTKIPVYGFMYDRGTKEFYYGKSPLDN